MAKEKEWYGRIQHKYDIEENWKKAVNFIPLVGELIIYGKDSNYNYDRFKVGDGVTLVNALPFTEEEIVRRLSEVESDISYIQRLIGYSEGLSFESNGDGTCALIGRGTWHGSELLIPPYAPNGDKVITIKDMAFTEMLNVGNYQGDLNITSVVFPSTVKEIGENAFRNCSNISNVIFNEGLEKIGESAFETGTNKIEKLHFPSTLKEIGFATFAQALADGIDVIISKNVPTISQYAFVGNRVNLYCEADSKPAGWHNDWSGFSYDNTIRWGFADDIVAVNKQLEAATSVINVTQLPEDDIDANKIYNLYTARFIQNRHVVPQSICHVVPERPTDNPVIALDAEGNINGYYNIQTNTVEGYYGGQWLDAATLFGANGWNYGGIISHISEDNYKNEEKTICLLLEKKVYIYDGKWIELTNSVIDERLPTPAELGHWAYTVQVREGRDPEPMLLSISHSANNAAKYQIPLRENGRIKTMSPLHELDVANREYVDNEIRKRAYGNPEHKYYTTNFYFYKNEHNQGPASIGLHANAEDSEQEHIPLRQGNGLMTCNVPEGAGDTAVVNKKYVDEIIKKIDVTEYIKNTDYASADNAGVVKVRDGTNGLKMYSNGWIGLNGATNNEVLNKTTVSHPLFPQHIDDIVKTGITTNKHTLTLDEQAAAQKWLGVETYVNNRVDSKIAECKTGYEEIKNGYELSLSFEDYNSATMSFTVECYPAPEQDIEIPILVTYYIEEEDFWEESINYFTIPAGSESIYEILVPAGNAQYGDVYFQNDSETEKYFIIHDNYSATYVIEDYARLAADKVCIRKEVGRDEWTDDPIYEYEELPTKKDVEDHIDKYIAATAAIILSETQAAIDKLSSNIPTIQIITWEEND